MHRIKDITGRRFGKLVALEYVGSSRSASGNRGYSIWLCKCDCGGTYVATAHSLQRGSTKSCGCLPRGRYSPRPVRDLTGLRFGRLTVTGAAADIVFPSGQRAHRFVCRCECGREVTVIGSNLISGNTTSCGCYRTEVARETMRNNHKNRRTSTVCSPDTI